MRALAKRSLYRVPLLGEAMRKTRLYWVKKTQPFSNSSNYWESRYKQGGVSGDGSYGRLAEFKAEILNGIVAQHQIQSILEYGCGDGNQLSLANYPLYTGVDVSPTAIQLCADRFAEDSTKHFVLLENKGDGKKAVELNAELVLSLDVIYHLVEEAVYQAYMESLFDTAQKFVVIYSSNKEEPGDLPHVRHREFSTWIDQQRPEWSLAKQIPNRFPECLETGKETSHADFYIYAKAA